ncbi:MAG: divalent metal cation transporter, partial [Bacteroidia bacterium]|nr:divalent metal cation transporter [Bacteroidia bacterium]
VLGMESIFGNNRLDLGSISINYYSLIIGVLAFILLYIGKYKILERVLVALVILMSLSFLITAILTKPDITEILASIIVPKAPKDSILTIIALIGTTVVPYNLFLHASLVKEKWSSINDLHHARRDTIMAVILGGLVSMCIIIAAAGIPGVEIESAADLAMAIEPLFGSSARYVLAIGLFAAGLTSAVTAPLAAAYVARGCIGFEGDMRSTNFRLVWILVLVLGVVSSTSGFKSIEIIKFAQVANGILLPVIAGFLLWIVNKKSVLGVHKNSFKHNLLGVIILAIAVFLGVKSILKVFQFL